MDKKQLERILLTLIDTSQSELLKQYSIDTGEAIITPSDLKEFEREVRGLINQYHG